MTDQDFCLELEETETTSKSPCVFLSFFLSSITTTGAVGGICALANILGNECCELANLTQEGKLEEARELQLQLIGPNQAVSSVCI